MTCTNDQDQWAGELDDDHDPDADQLPCPSCGAMFYDDTDRCPHCGDWIMPLAASARSKSRIWIIAAILAVIGMLIWALT